MDTLKNRIIAEISAATDDNVYVSTIPEEVPPSPDEIMFEISPGPNISFDGPIFVGAGKNSLNTNMEFVVTVHLTQQKDETGRDEQFLEHASLGAFPLMRLVLKALAEHDPQDTSSNYQLSQMIRPVAAHIPPRDDREIGYFTLRFELVFDWDMS
jgi:hypothetical protein